jgi:hypothetical protein
VNRSMFTKSDRSVGLGGMDDWCIRLPTDMILGQKEVNFWVRSRCEIERDKTGEKDEKRKTTEGPRCTDTHDISNHGGPRLMTRRSTDTSTSTDTD